MIPYIARRLVLAVPLLGAVSTLAFLLLHLVPGDAVDFMLGERAETSQKEALRQAYHLDAPWFVHPAALSTAIRAAAIVPRVVGGEKGAEPELVRTGRLGIGAVVVAVDALGEARVLHLVRRMSHGLEPPELREMLLQTPAAGLSAFVHAHPGAFAPQGLPAFSLIFTETQYAWFLSDLVGRRLRSLQSGRPVFGILRARLPFTIVLALSAMVVAIVGAVPLGTVAGARPGGWLDRCLSAGAAVGLSMPSFWLGPLMILGFSIHLGWTPVSGADSWRHLPLPSVTLGLGAGALLARMTRTAVADTLEADHVRVARAKGLSEWRVVTRHALRVGIVPVITVVGLQVGSLLAGSVITEEIFGWPGLGRELIGAIRARDLPVVQGCVLLIATLYVVVNTVTDLLCVWANPQVRHDR